MIQRQPFNQLFLIMASAALLVSAISIVSLYKTAIEQHRLRLVETVKGQARLIEAIAKFDDLENSDNSPALARQSTLEKVAAAYQEFEGFGTSGEFVIARQNNNEIQLCSVFDIHRHPNYERFHSMASGRSRCGEPCPGNQG